MRREEWEPERIAETEKMAWPELDRLLAAVADENGIPSRVLTGRMRTRRVSDVRSVFCWRAHELGYSWPEIGAFLHRDWTTVRHLGLLQKRRLQVATPPECVRENLLMIREANGR